MPFKIDPNCETGTGAVWVEPVKMLSLGHQTFYLQVARVRDRVRVRVRVRVRIRVRVRVRNRVSHQTFYLQLTALPKGSKNGGISTDFAKSVRGPACLPLPPALACLPPALACLTAHISAASRCTRARPARIAG